MTIAKAKLSEMARQALMHRARYAYPLEVCGFIMNSADPDTEQFIFDVPNVHRDPRHHWAMNPSWQLLAMRNEENIFGVWHTHPSGPDGPSETDYRYMTPGLRFFVATRNGVFEYEMRETA
jgi:proteasome lid subunit RPN8/RPN11